MIVNQYGREVREADEPVRDAEQVADALTGPLAQGLTWLYDTVQPDGSIPRSTHFGDSISVPLVGRRLMFAPNVDDGPVIVVESTEYDSEYGPRPPRHGLAPGELEAVVRVVTGVFGRRVLDTWNGHPCTSGSMRLADPAHPSLRAALAHYHARCPEHDTVFCGNPIRESDEPCSWLRDACRLAVRP